MATIKNRLLFFTTSPRTPSKMIPEIKLLNDNFEDEIWNVSTQKEFMDKLSKSDFFEGKGSSSNKDFSARDRITRAPKSLGFVDLKPVIKLTEAGNALVYGNRPKEIFLRQLLKFQLPSPYHVEHKSIQGTFYIRPYLEILRLIRELEYISFDEFKIFAVQMTDYRKFDSIKNKILQFRNDKKNNVGKYKQFVGITWENAILEIYKDRIVKGQTKTRETQDASLQKFIKTQKGNMRDYADACFRYLRYTELVAISQKNRSISIFKDKLIEVDYILKNVEKALKENGLYEAYDDMVLIKQALIERDRKIYGLQQHNRNLEDKLGRIGGYHYGNPKQ